MKRAAPWEATYDISSDDSSDSDSDNDPLTNKKGGAGSGGSRSLRGVMSEGALIRRAKMYQEYMKDIPIPHRRGSVIPFLSWQGLATSLKLLYRQPLHYLTNVQLMQWDQARIGSETEHLPLDSVIHPTKAEATIWLTEEIHRLTSSYHHLAKLWASDPMYDAYIDASSPVSDYRFGSNE